MKTDRQPTKSFRYPPQPGRDEHPMCADGQRRCIFWLSKLVQEAKTGIQTPETRRIQREAALAERDLTAAWEENDPTARRPHKRRLLAYQAYRAYLEGSSNYVTDEGYYLLQIPGGRQILRNIHTDLANGKKLY